MDKSYCGLLIFADGQPGDEDEPNLRAYATLDTAALKDIQAIGTDYVHSFGAVLHTNEGLKPGYLPQSEATAVLSCAINLLSLASYFEERAAKLKCEAHGRVMVALAGSPPNCLFQLLE